ncbi:RraA family protein [Pseudomonas helleri]|uniref:RraA family protein n=1 Tax=Pseudomonas helleri TaxID=1608996 RepID=A0A7X2CH34_9PSED|nr:diguanylate cyclase [Pseudomonas helleri]KMN23322.1 diguanylate cyclase [Pseudomonas helleri]MQT94876.1 RraA family protein [Pseudomonas helleri]MQU31235.1 RraA family protein [Pseudomonas helleri]
MKLPCLLDRLAALDTNTVSDALDFLGIKGATAGLRPLWNCPKIVGRASTVLLGPKGDNLPTVHLITPVVERIDSDDRVLVIAGGLEGISCWGDTLANAAVSKRVRGTVIDGFSRDIDGNASIGYPVFGRGVTMISARNRVVQIDSAVTITVAGVEVSEDDYVIADNCGTVFVPQASIEQVVTIGERITRRQNAMVDAIRAGRSVAEVMHDSQFDAINAEHAQ